MSSADRVVVDILFNVAWRDRCAQERRLRPSVSGQGSWAMVRLAEGRELVAGVASIADLDRIRTQQPYYVRRAAGAAPEPVTTLAEVIDLWDDGTPGFERFREALLQCAAGPAKA
ncbi:MAG: hypothetical protein HYX59_16040 [Elusimicrobia bacterium]|nr:hypothetical protein [Elusimicrobiota bacterium]